MTDPYSRAQGDAVNLVVDLPPLSALDTWKANLTPASRRLIDESRVAIGSSGVFAAGTGHQPGFFHAGILAKFIAADSIASERGAASNWIHFASDADTHDPLRIDLPLRSPDGGVRRGSVSLARPERVPPHAPACIRAVGRVIDEGPEREALGAAVASERGEKVLTAALDACAQSAEQAPDAAMQVARACESMMSAWVRPSAATVPTRTLIATPMGRWAVEAILSRPAECARAFNGALAFEPHSARFLRESGDASEVPLWGVAADGARLRLNAVGARRALAAGELVLPRAFLASGLMRLVVDLFVHGTGGAHYERAGDRWWREFLGIELPPFAVVSASLYPSPAALGIPLRLDANPGVRFREAWWNPALLPDNPASAAHSAERAELLRCIADARRRSPERRAAYCSLLESISRGRASATAQLDSLKSHESHHARALKESALLTDRTWPFLLLDPSAIDGLVVAIRARVHSTGATSAKGSGR